jgi:exopolysaccharide production protein ExoQ
MITQNQNSPSIVYYYLAKILFILFIFISFFGMAKPFPSVVSEVEEIHTSNFVNQIIYSLFFLTACILIIAQRNKILQLVKKDTLIALFLLWCTLTIIWSSYSTITSKRLFQLYTEVMVICTSLAYLDNEKNIIKIFRSIVYLYIILTLISVFTVPGAKDPVFGTWRGLTPHKNELGQMGVITTILCSIFFKSENSLFSKMIAFIMILFSIIIIFGSQSTTAILSFCAVLIFVLFLFVMHIFTPLKIGPSFGIFIGLNIIFMFFLIMVFSPDVFQIIPEFFGKDMSFTGRTELWLYMLTEIKSHILTGCGYDGFWTIKNAAVLNLFSQFIWLPNQAHNGYIDLFNETGLIGFIIFIMIIIRYYTSITKTNFSENWQLFILIAIIFNFQETSFFRVRNIINVMFIFSYYHFFNKQTNPINQILVHAN